MTKYEINQKLNNLYKEREVLTMMDEVTTCKVYSTDSKQDIVDLINADIELYEGLLVEFEPHTANYVATADNPYICW